MRVFLIIAAFVMLACHPRSKRTADMNIGNAFESKHLASDTLPNGKKILDNGDTSMLLYYRETVTTDSLKGGYVTCYEIDDSMKYFYLRHGDTLHLLNSTPKNTTSSFMGVLERDFDSFFITRIINGPTRPETYQAFDKATGKNMLGDDTEAWQYAYIDGSLLLLYDNHSINRLGITYEERDGIDSLYLFNVRSATRTGYKLPTWNRTSTINYGEIKIGKHEIIITCFDDDINTSKVKKTILKYYR